MDLLTYLHHVTHARPSPVAQTKSDSTNYYFTAVYTITLCNSVLNGHFSGPGRAFGLVCA